MRSMEMWLKSVKRVNTGGGVTQDDCGSRFLSLSYRFSLKTLQWHQTQASSND